MGKPLTPKQKRVWQDVIPLIGLTPVIPLISQNNLPVAAIFILAVAGQEIIIHTSRRGLKRPAEGTRRTR